MSNDDAFPGVFDRLKQVMKAHAGSLECKHDESDNYYLDTRHIMKNKKPLFFGAVQIKKNYVSYHLMPVYVEPALLDGMSAGLSKRMQGKSCFNFREVSAELFTELAELTKAAYASYEKSGYV